MNKSNQTLPALSAEQTAVMEQLASRLTGASYDKNLFSLSVQFAADAAAHINAAHRPVIVAGYSSVRAQAGDALSRLAEAMHIPVIYTDKAKGITPGDRSCIWQPHGKALPAGWRKRSTASAACATRNPGGTQPCAPARNYSSATWRSAATFRSRCARKRCCLMCATA